jgi:hypothetical protein
VLDQVSVKMDLQKINVKFFAVENEPVPLTAFIDIFHSWIQASDGIYHDVADYSHMTNGPGIVLVAHDANVHIDETGGRRGLLYTQKALLPGSNQERLRVVLHAALENCRKLEQEPAVREKLKFSGDEVLISVNDRLLAPNTTESFQALKPDVEAVAGQLFNGASFALSYKEDSRRRFSIAVRTFERFDVDGLIANIGGEARYA